MNVPATQYVVRIAQPDDIPLLPEIERAAGALFKTHSAELGLTDEISTHVNSVETLEAARQAGRLWVAATSTGEIVGFALMLEIGGYAHLEELDVLPAHARRGLGSALLTAVCSWAKEAGYPAVTLRTFRDIPWNAPFYERRGFKVIESCRLSAAHVQLEAVERQRGLRTDLRVTMVT